MQSTNNCAITHAQISSGVCPYCSLPIQNGGIATSRGAIGITFQWDVPRMLKDLGGEDVLTRLVTITNLATRLATLGESLLLLRIALEDTDERVREAAFRAAVLLAEGPKDDTVTHCETALRQDKNDTAAMTVILFVYTSGQFHSEHMRKSRESLILRVIEEMPDCWLAGTPLVMLQTQINGDAYGRAKSLWLSHVRANPFNIRLLANAAKFFGFAAGEDDALAGELLRRCKSLENDSPIWPMMLGDLYSSQKSPQDPQSRIDWGLMGLVELEDSLRLARDEESRFLSLMSLPRVALQAGDLSKARYYSQELLAAGTTQNNAMIRGYAVYEANTILGWVAFTEDDIDQAKARLLASITPDCRGTPFVFGPQCGAGPLMHLVKGLLQRGERESVVEYLRRCQFVEPKNRDLLSSWIAEIEQGGMPDLDEHSRS